jgi:hypothetical protein
MQSQVRHLAANQRGITLESDRAKSSSLMVAIQSGCYSIMLSTVKDSKPHESFIQSFTLSAFDINVPLLIHSYFHAITFT